MKKWPASQPARPQAPVFTLVADQLLGKDQMDWLTTQMASSTATWQVLMARMEFPVSVLAALSSTDTSTVAQAAGKKAVNDYIVAKNTLTAVRTDTQKGLIDTSTNPKHGYNA
jgi:alkaline phosphatase D